MINSFHCYCIVSAYLCELKNIGTFRTIIFSTEVYKGCLSVSENGMAGCHSDILWIVSTCALLMEMFILILPNFNFSKLPPKLFNFHESCELSMLTEGWLTSSAMSFMCLHWVILYLVLHLLDCWRKKLLWAKCYLWPLMWNFVTVVNGKPLVSFCCAHSVC